MHEIKKVFVIGNGAIEGGNEPLDTFLEILQPYNITSFNAKALGMEATFSCLVAQEYHWLEILRATANDEFTPPKGQNESNGIDLLLKHAAGPVSARMRLGKEYEKCTELSFRKPVLEIMKQEGLFDSDSAVVTTNWDLTLWNVSNLQNLCYLHGRCDDPLTIILPTQSWATNSLRHHLGQQICKSKTIQNSGHWKEEEGDLIKRWLTPLQNLNTYEANNYFFNWLKQADDWYFCGLGLNAYDHELILDLSNATGPLVRKKLPRLTLINCEENKIEKIRRASAITGVKANHVRYIASDT